MTTKLFLDDHSGLGLSVTVHLADGLMVITIIDQDKRLYGAKIRIEMPLTKAAETDLGDVITELFRHEYIFRASLYSILSDMRRPLNPPTKDIFVDDDDDDRDPTPDPPTKRTDPHAIAFRIIEGGKKHHDT